MRRPSLPCARSLTCLLVWLSLCCLGTLHSQSQAHPPTQPKLHRLLPHPHHTQQPSNQQPQRQRSPTPAHSLTPPHTASSPAEHNGIALGAATPQQDEAGAAGGRGPNPGGAHRALPTSHPGQLVVPLSLAETEALCGHQAPHAALYAPAVLDAMLVHWRAHDNRSLAGISPAMMDAAMEEADENPLHRGKRIGVLFEGGRPFIVSSMKFLRHSKHHRGLLTAYMLLMLRLSRLFGAAIPDVEFAVSTGDAPAKPLSRLPAGELPLPVFRFCSSAAFADVLVPDVHFFMNDYDSRMLNESLRKSKDWPWTKRRKTLFGRFSPYKRVHIDGSGPADNATYKLGVGGQRICRGHPGKRMFCPVRRHFMNYTRSLNVTNLGVKVDVAQQPKVEMSWHCRYRWLLHLDGQTCSSRLEQLLSMGSAVFKEHSGYNAFFHHLLAPYHTYVPFWEQVPEDITAALAWAQQHDAEAQAIGLRGQALAVRYLNSQAQACYWLQLLRRFAALLTYRPGSAGDRSYLQKIAVSDWLAPDAQGGKYIRMYDLHHLVPV